MNCSKGLVWRDDKKACDKPGKVFMETVLAVTSQMDRVTHDFTSLAYTRIWHGLKNAAVPLADLKTPIDGEGFFKSGPLATPLDYTFHNRNRTTLMNVQELLLTDNQ